MDERSEAAAKKAPVKKVPGIKERLKAMGNPSAQDLPARIMALELRVTLLEGKR